MVEDFRLHSFKRSPDKGSGRRLVATSAKLLGHLVAFQRAPAAKADFETTFGLFDQNDGKLGTLNFQAMVHQIFGIRGQRTGFREILFEDIGVGQSTLLFDADSIQHQSPQPQSPQ